VRRTIAIAASVLAAACIHVSPAAKSPLKEKLAPLSQSQLQEVAGACLEGMGWKMDPYPQPFGDTMRVRFTKADASGALYVYPQGATPRLTGDMAEGGDAFWKCLDDALR
jgi:hypothetical protein